MSGQRRGYDWPALLVVVALVAAYGLLGGLVGGA